MDLSLNRKINQLFLNIATRIYESDLSHNDTKGWRPLRPTKLDYPIAPFIFSELIRLLKKADLKKIPTTEIAALFGSSEIIGDLQFLWPSLGWRQNEISFEDKLYLISKLIEFTYHVESDSEFVNIYEQLAQQSKEGEDPNAALKLGTKLYFNYLRPLYEHLGEDWNQALGTATKLVLAKQGEVEEPLPWGETTKDKAIRHLVRNSDFRREKEKGLEELSNGVPLVPGIAEGIVGDTIIVAFSIEEQNPKADAYITNIDPFKNQDLKEKLAQEGVVVIGQTRTGTTLLKPGEKVWVDGTSGIIYKHYAP